MAYANHCRPRTNKTGWRGVTFDPDTCKARPYLSRICIDRRDKTLGRYATPEEAARTYDAWAKKIWGDRAVLNFPDE